MSQETRQNETKGSLDDRVVALERSLLNRWERWFDRNPGIVLGTVVVALFSGFWMYYTWQIDRIDKLHQQELTRITDEHESKIKWLRDQQLIRLESEKDKCGVEKQRIFSKLEACENSSQK